MIPSILTNQVKLGLEDLVRSTVNVSTPLFAGMVDRFLSDPENFIKGPWLSLDLPFRKSTGTTGEFFPQVPLGFTPHSHQVRAFERLAYPNAKPTIVATGTGSGKTEAFLWPIFDACVKAGSEPGIKAIIIYPMNALAGDQARRIAGAVKSIPALKKLRVGIYADAQPIPSSTVMTDDEVITDREEMQRNPPDILLTNYKMLDYLLIRPADQALWAMNTPTTLRYLVVDELHTFDGAQGTDLALLIRRIKAKLGIPEGQLACVGTSATLGSGGTADIIDYASKVFGETFASDSVVVEDRLSAAEYLATTSLTDVRVPNGQAVAALMETIDGTEQPDAIAAIADLLLTAVPPGSPENPDWRVALGDDLRGHVLFHELIRATDGKPTSYESLEAHFAERTFLKDLDRATLRPVIDAVVALIGFARSRRGARLEPLLNVRAQLWVRELARMVVTVDPQAPELRHSDDISWELERRALPLVCCRQCGTAAWVGMVNQRRSGLWAEPRAISDGYFDGSDRLRFIYPEAIPPQQGVVAEGFINAQTLAFEAGDPPVGDPLAVRAWLVNPTGMRGRVSHVCPACGSSSLALVGVRAARATSSVVSTLFGSLHNGEPHKDESPKLLMFSDSVQDAAQRASVVENRNVAAVLRKEAVQFLDQQRRGRATLDDLLKNGPPAFRTAAGDDGFVATFIPSDMQWMRDYEALVRDDQLPAGSRMANNVQFRVGWELFGDLTFWAAAGQSLEMTGLAAIHTDAAAIREAARIFVESFADRLGTAAEPPPLGDAIHFLTGLYDYMRAHGAADHLYVERLAYQSMNSFAAAASLAQYVLPKALPSVGRNRSAEPVLPTTLSSLSERFAVVARQTPGNWYRAWADKFFNLANVFAGSLYADIYRHAFECSEQAGAARRLDVLGQVAAPVYALKVSALVVDRSVASVACDTCGKVHRVPAAVVAMWDGMPCTKMGCAGSFGTSTNTYWSEFLDRLFSKGRNHRVIAREHTGILDATDRKRLETRFIHGTHPWDPNTLSATPTLEMGINIGDLSTLILSSVPPEQANYVQRIGRTGRRDGNSLNVTIVNARAHDLQFWKAPEKMIRGQVRSPGVHLGAIAVLKRQVAAMSLDRFIAVQPQGFEYGKMKAALTAIEKSNQGVFPNTWLDFIAKNAQPLSAAFLGMLPAPVRANAELVQQLDQFVSSAGNDGLRYHIANAFARARIDRDKLESRLKDVRAAIRTLDRENPRPTDYTERRDGLGEDAGILRATITRTIDEVLVLQYLTDHGVLPNYAFPEEGVTLQSVIYWRAGSDGSAGGRPPQVHEYPRPAASALSELAPNAEFYAQGRRARVDQIDLTDGDIQEYRICDTCTHMELAANVPPNQAACPKCGSQMWGDVGRKRKLVELRTVIATTEASRSAIEDRDDRRIARYDREILPDYPDTAVSQAFALDRMPGSVPFGYEYITSCRFRDLNFGPLRDAAVGGEVAGSQRFSSAFPVCSECGKLQEPRQPGDPGTHTARCRFVAEIDPDKYEEDVYLYRTFQSEAVRIVVPVIGIAQQDDVKSFVAALDIGFRKHFSGKVDHIRSTVVEQHSQSRATTVRNLYFYDAVPGGTAYLKQVASDPDVMRDVLTLALAHLQTCSCNTDPLADGCFQCVRSYRSSFGAGEASRNRAIRMLQEVLQDWKTLHQIGSVTDMVQKDIFDSELEVRFIEKLKEAVTVDGLWLPVVLPSGRTGYQVRFGADGARWTIEDHVWVKDRFGIAVDTEADFLFTPVGIKGATPVAVFLDGWQFHQGKIASDVDKRLSVIRSGGANVWTLTWDDLKAGLGDQPHYPDLLGSAPTAANMTSRLGDQGALAGAIRGHRPFQSLVAHLREPVHQERESSLTYLGMITTLSGSPPTHTGVMPAHVSAVAVKYVSEAQRSGSREDGGISLCFGYSSRPNQSHVFDLEARYVVGLHLEKSKDPKRDWNGFFHLVNTFQFAPGLHVDVDGLTLALPDRHRAVHAPPPDADWLDVEDLVDTSVKPLVSRLKAAGVPAPTVGVDLMSGDSVAGSIELAWEEKRVGVVLAPLAAEGWTLLDINDVLADTAGLMKLLGDA